jgi:hypothetical protein
MYIYKRSFTKTGDFFQGHKAEWLEHLSTNVKVATDSIPASFHAVESEGGR